MLGKRACVNKSGPKVFTTKVFCSFDMSTVWSVSSSGRSMTPATWRRRSMVVSAPMAVAHQLIESGEVMSSCCTGQERDLMAGPRF